MTYQRNETPEPLATREEKVVMREVIRDERYEGGGYTMSRESGETPNGNPIGRRWVLRDSSGTFLGVDNYRFDLAEEYNLKLASP